MPEVNKQGVSVLKLRVEDGGLLSWLGELSTVLSPGAQKEPSDTMVLCAGERLRWHLAEDKENLHWASLRLKEINTLACSCL